MKQTLAMISIIVALIFGSIGALLAADFQAGVAATQKGDYAAALREWTPLAEQGDAEAQYNLGDDVLCGTGRSKPRLCYRAFVGEYCGSEWQN